jgi:hypothetical protein
MLAFVLTVWAGPNIRTFMIVLYSDREKESVLSCSYRR